MEPPADDIATTEQAPAPDISLRDANPQWLYRIFLGVSGMAIGQAITLGYLALMFIWAVAARASVGKGDLLSWLPHADPMGYAIFWFSAIFLLAAPHHADDHHPRLAIFRKAVFYLGCAYLLSRFLPSAFQDLRGGNWAPYAITAFNIAATTALFLYLIQLARRADDPYLKQHLS
jgi:hypothetical protein